MAGLASIYVATSEKGVKVGYSNNYRARFKQIAAAIGCPVGLNFITEPMDNAPAVEGLAHWYLREHHIGAEWFSCDAVRAWDAVNRAIEGVARGEAPERRVGNATPFSELKDIRLTLDLPSDMIEAVDEWRRWQPRIPSRGEAIRRLVASAIDADERKPKAGQ